MQDGEPDPKPQKMAPTAGEAERIQDGCWSSKRCLREERGQEEKIGREERGQQTNRLERCNGYQNSCTNQ